MLAGRACTRGEDEEEEELEVLDNLRFRNRKTGKSVDIVGASSAPRDSVAAVEEVAS